MCTEPGISSVLCSSSLQQCFTRKKCGDCECEKGVHALQPVDVRFVIRNKLLKLFI